MSETDERVAELEAQLEAMRLANPPLTLRCGACFRDLTTPHGKRAHTLYEDGSMVCNVTITRCWAMGWGPQVRELVAEVRHGW